MSVLRGEAARQLLARVQRQNRDRVSGEASSAARRDSAGPTDTARSPGDEPAADAPAERG